MKIVLATIHSNGRFTPLALLYLKAYLVERCGFGMEDVPILEFGQKDGIEEMVERLLAAKPKVLGLSCYIWNVLTLMKVAERVKQALPDTTIVLGGPEIGPVSRSVLERNPFVDAIVKSEGEIPFGEIVMRLRSGDPLRDVQGIAYRHGDTVVENGNAPILRDLNLLPSPHQPQYGDFSDRLICIETQRGCVFRCNFCFYNKDFSIRNRRFDLERVEKELLYWLQRDVAQIYLMDPIFNLNAERAKEICRFIIRNNRRNVRFHTEIWAEFVDEEMARLFREANFSFLEVGLQTTDDAVLDAVDRPMKADKFVTGIRNLNKYELNAQLQLILGLPGETLESFRRSLDFAVSLKPSDLEVFDLMVLPGTELWNKAGLLELVYDPKPPYGIRRTPSLSESDFQKAREWVPFVRVLRRSMAMELLCKEFRLTLTGLVEEMVEAAGRQDERNWREIWSKEWAQWLEDFVRDFCVRKGTNPDFYVRLIGLEFKGLLHSNRSEEGPVVHAPPEPALGRTA